MPRLLFACKDFYNIFCEMYLYDKKFKKLSYRIIQKRIRPKCRNPFIVQYNYFYKHLANDP